MPTSDFRTLIEIIGPRDRGPDSVISDAGQRIALRDLGEKTNLSGPVTNLRGRSVLLATTDQLPTVLALAHLDGVVRRVTICPPDVSVPHLRDASADAEVDCIVTDGLRDIPDLGGAVAVVRCGMQLEHEVEPAAEPVETEWLLFTSGTTGRPKLVQHSLRTLTGAVADGVGAGEAPPVWSTFYDVRRYGGLQVLLRALASTGSMVLSDTAEGVSAFLRRVGEAGVTHISGTPSHWRRALMSGHAGSMSPRYVRLSGEAADQAILDALQAAFPEAEVAHAFASTEAGVAFDVRDGKAGFPASLLSSAGRVSLAVEGGTLRIRSPRTAARYVGAEAPALPGRDGFIDTGDVVEKRGDRYIFIGRRHDIINVGGLKVHPERVEAVINRHPAVSVSRVSARANPITGAIVVADVVLGPREDDAVRAKAELLALCQNELARHEVPASFRVVRSLPVAPSGKLLRQHA